MVGLLVIAVSITLFLITMYALLHLSAASAKTNRFIRPENLFDVASAAWRLVLSGWGFAAALAYTKASSRGLVDEFVYAFIAVLSNVRMLSMDDMCTILDLYMGTNSICKVTCLMS